MSRRCIVIPLPVSPVEKLAATFKNYLHLPDPSPLYVLMGAVAANMIEGSPVWLMLIGPPSCGKTELLTSLLSIPYMVEGADISGPAAFLSGTSERDSAADATGGLLRQTGDHGALILNDFTSILSLPGDRLMSIMAVFREAFSGRWTRHIGGEGGRVIRWDGKLGLFAGCTGTIDQRHQVSAELGERWINWRFPAQNDECFAEVMMALSNGRNGWRMDLQEAVRDFYSKVGLRFGATIPRRDFLDSERVRIYELASLAARCRSGVARDAHNHEIIGARESELAIRLSTVLSQLLIGMDYIGVNSVAQWKLLAKVAMDSMPRLRKMTIESVAASDLTVNDLRTILECSLSVCKRVVEDLEIHGVVYRESGRLHLTPWMAERYHRFLPASNQLTTTELTL